MIFGNGFFRCIMDYPLRPCFPFPKIVEEIDYVHYDR